ncbi:DUF1648 domain-containing protein [Arthrobacter bambusae]|uniref:DUF1648 domain-containing protein n=1 Tax=Arthrobacter bambusae TaxID=1338426 RepID=UPI0027809729|nr:DUF5808 domain-containing protein [Arthrobacter bambusae]MDQ0029636.1 putative membrane protein [Arthrobacter bambusae]MDQ0097296.1 putative membrane protein [Arthrobacter bambusae]
MTIAIVLSFALAALVLAIALALPSINSPTVPFGVRVPAQRAEDPAVVRQTRIYRWRVLLSGIVTTGVCLAIYAMTGETLLLPLSVLVLVGFWYGCFFLANHEIRAAKAAGAWYEGVRQGIAVDTGLRTNPPRFPWLWLAPGLIIIIATAVIGMIAYPSMPDVLAVHRGANGIPDRLAAKSVATAFSLVFVQIGVSAVLVGIAAAIIFGSRPDIDPAHPAGSAHWHRRYMLLGAKALLGLLAMINLAMLGSSLLMWTGTVTPWASLAVVLPILASVAVAVVVFARNNRARDEGEDDTGLAHREDDKYWRSGLFYVNREDRALMVPRRFGLGWTLNFGNPRATMLLAGIVALVVLLITIRFGG